MKNNLTILNDIIRGRRSMYPQDFLRTEIPDNIILEILENANCAPNYKKTEPWRFKILKGQKQKDLGTFLADFYKTNTSIDNFNPEKHAKMLKKTSLGGAMILICMQRDPEERVQEWEEIAAVSMAVQNMWLTCHTLGIGAYWGTPASCKNMNKFVDMADGEVCLGLFYMGYLEDNKNVPSKRSNIIEKIIWYKD